MILVDTAMPKNCLHCKLKAECIVYDEWLKSDETKAPKPSDHYRCLIKGEVKDAGQES